MNISDIFQNIDPSLLPYLGLGCALLCVVAVVLGFLLQAVSGIFEIVFGIIEVFVDILQGGPVAWCGCGLLIIGFALSVGLALVLLNAPESCSLQPTNFCRWLGFLP